jgi:hypothetical protein
VSQKTDGSVRVKREEEGVRTSRGEAEARADARGSGPRRRRQRQREGLEGRTPELTAWTTRLVEGGFYLGYRHRFLLHISAVAKLSMKYLS